MKSSAARANKRTSRPLARAIAARRPLVLDGAMGTELERRGIATGLPLWSAHALLTSPGTVRRIHDEYIASGADIITANTFRTTRRTFSRGGLPDQSAELTTLAVTLAREAIAASRRKKTLLAGSMAPLEDCYSPKLVPPDEALREEHAEHAACLAEAGVDFLLLETMGTLREAVAAAEAAGRTGLEFVVSFLCTREGSLYNGDQLPAAIRAIMSMGPAAISLNCISPRDMARPLSILQASLCEIPGLENTPVGVYANVGTPGGENESDFHRDIEADEYARYARAWAGAGVSIIGGCCGTTPEYIRAAAGATR